VFGSDAFHIYSFRQVELKRERRALSEVSFFCRDRDLSRAWIEAIRTSELRAASHPKVHRAGAEFMTMTAAKKPRRAGTSRERAIRRGVCRRCQFVRSLVQPVGWDYAEGERPAIGSPPIIRCACAKTRPSPAVCPPSVVSSPELDTAALRDWKPPSADTPRQTTRTCSAYSSRRFVVASATRRRACRSRKYDPAPIGALRSRNRPRLAFIRFPPRAPIDVTGPSMATRTGRPEDCDPCSFYEQRKVRKRRAERLVETKDAVP
jgi:hypothetical protein